MLHWLWHLCIVWSACAHRYVLEDGGMKQTDEQQLEFKRQVDPDGLMNPGKMRAFEEGRANYDGSAGYGLILIVNQCSKFPQSTTLFAI